jgi:hypothetical protein
MHVTLETTGSLLGRIMEMVFPAAVLGRHVAPVAKCVPLDKHLSAVRFMAILANYTRHIHLALEEGAIDIYLIQDLSVCKIEILFKQGWPVCFQQGATMIVIFGGDCAA